MLANGNRHRAVEQLHYIIIMEDIALKLVLWLAYLFSLCWHFNISGNFQLSHHDVISYMAHGQLVSSLKN